MLNFLGKFLIYTICFVGMFCLVAYNFFLAILVVLFAAGFWAFYTATKPKS